MAEFTANSQSFRTSLPFFDVGPDTDLVNQFPGLNAPVMENSCLNSQNLFSLSNTNFYCQQAPEFPGSLDENFLDVFLPANQNSAQVSQSSFAPKAEFQESRKRKAADISESSSRNSPVPDSDSGTKRKHSSGRGKRVKNREKEEEKPKEVVHVRARRGQATDSHSLAERIRRQKINERLKCLQNIVPGCYKTMGMAVMLDEIINYVQSLQNQVEFLSMKLTTASSFYDFNSEMDPMVAMQVASRRAKAIDAKEVERLMAERQGGQHGLQPQWPF